MLTPVTKTFDKVQVTFTPLPILSASALDARVTALVLPLLKFLQGLLEKKDVDLSKLDIDLDLLGQCMSQVLSGISSSEQQVLIVESLKGCTVLIQGSAPVEITDAGTLNKAFLGQDLITLYRIVFEAWRYNKLSPFALVDRFGLSVKTSTENGQPSGAKLSGLKLVR